MPNTVKNRASKTSHDGPHTPHAPYAPHAPAVHAHAPAVHAHAHSRGGSLFENSKLAKDLDDLYKGLMYNLAIVNGKQSHELDKHHKDFTVPYIIDKECGLPCYTGLDKNDAELAASKKIYKDFFDDILNNVKTFESLKPNGNIQGNDTKIFEWIKGILSAKVKAKCKTFAMSTVKNYDSTKAKVYETFNKTLLDKFLEKQNVKLTIPADEIKTQPEFPTNSRECDFMYGSLTNDVHEDRSLPLLFLNCLRAIICLYDAIANSDQVKHAFVKVSPELKTVLRQLQLKNVTTFDNWKTKTNSCNVLFSKKAQLQEYFMNRFHEALEVYNFCQQNAEDKIKTFDELFRCKVTELQLNENIVMALNSNINPVYLIPTDTEKDDENYILKWFSRPDDTAEKKEYQIGMQNIAVHHHGCTGSNLEEEQKSNNLLGKLEKAENASTLKIDRQNAVESEKKLDDVQHQIELAEEEPLTAESTKRIIELKNKEIELKKTSLEAQATLKKTEDTVKSAIEKDNPGEYAEMQEAKKSVLQKQVIEAIVDRLRAKCSPFNIAYETWEGIPDQENKDIFWLVEMQEYGTIIKQQYKAFVANHASEDTMIGPDDDELINDMADFIAERLTYANLNNKTKMLEDKYNSNITNVMKHVMTIGMCHWYYASNIMYFDSRRQKYENCRALCILHLGNEGGACMVGSLVLFPTGTCKNMENAKKDGNSKCSIVQIRFRNDASNKHVQMLADWALLHVFPPVLTFTQTIVTYDHIDNPEMQVGRLVQLNLHSHKGSIAKILKNNGDGTYTTEVYKRKHCTSVKKKAGDADDDESEFKWVVRSSVKAKSGKPFKPAPISMLNIKYEDDVMQPSEKQYIIDDPNIIFYFDLSEGQYYYKHLVTGNKVALNNFIKTTPYIATTNPLHARGKFNEQDTISRTLEEAVEAELTKRKDREVMKDDEFAILVAKIAKAKIEVISQTLKDAIDKNLFTCEQVSKLLQKLEGTSAQKRRDNQLEILKLLVQHLYDPKKNRSKIESSFKDADANGKEEIAAILNGATTQQAGGGRELEKFRHKDSSENLQLAVGDIVWSTWAAFDQPDVEESGAIEEGDGDGGDGKDNMFFNSDDEGLKKAGKVLFSITGAIGSLGYMTYVQYKTKAMKDELNKKNVGLGDTLLKFSLQPSNKKEDANIRLEFEIQTQYITMAPMILGKLLKYSEANDQPGVSARRDIHAAYDRLKKSYNDYTTRNDETYSKSQEIHDMQGIDFDLEADFAEYEKDARLKGRIKDDYAYRKMATKMEEERGSANKRVNKKHTKAHLESILKKQYAYQQKISEMNQKEEEDKIFERLYEAESFSRQLLHSASTLHVTDAYGTLPINAWEVQTKPFEYTDKHLLDMVWLSDLTRKTRVTYAKGVQTGGMKMKMKMPKSFSFTKNTFALTDWIMKKTTRRANTLEPRKDVKIALPVTGTLSKADRNDAEILDILRTSDPLWKAFMGTGQTIGNQEIDIKLPIFFLKTLLETLLKTKEIEDNARSEKKLDSLVHFSTLSPGSVVRFSRDPKYGISAYLEMEEFFPSKKIVTSPLRVKPIKTAGGLLLKATVTSIEVHALDSDNNDGILVDQGDGDISKQTAVYRLEHVVDKANSYPVFVKEIDHEVKIINPYTPNLDKIKKEKLDEFQLVFAEPQRAPLVKKHHAIGKLDLKDVPLTTEINLKFESHSDSKKADESIPFINCGKNNPMPMLTEEPYYLKFDMKNMKDSINLEVSELTTASSPALRLLKKRHGEHSKNMENLNICMYLYRTRIGDKELTKMQLLVTDSSRDILIGRLGDEEELDENEQKSPGIKFAKMRKKYLETVDNIQICVTNGCMVKVSQAQTGDTLALPKNYYVLSTVIQVKEEEIVISESTPEKKETVHRISELEFRLRESEDGETFTITPTVTEINGLLNDFGDAIVTRLEDTDKNNKPLKDHTRKAHLFFPSVMYDVVINEDILPMMLEEAEGAKISREFQTGDAVIRKTVEDITQMPTCTYISEDETLYEPFKWFESEPSEVKKECTELLFSSVKEDQWRDFHNKKLVQMNNQSLTESIITHQPLLYLLVLYAVQPTKLEQPGERASHYAKDTDNKKEAALANLNLLSSTAPANYSNSTVLGNSYGIFYNSNAETFLAYRITIEDDKIKVYTGEDDILHPAQFCTEQGDRVTLRTDIFERRVFDLTNPENKYPAANSMLSKEFIAKIEEHDKYDRMKLKVLGKIHESITDDKCYHIHIPRTKMGSIFKHNNKFSEYKVGDSVTCPAENIMTKVDPQTQTQPQLNLSKGTKYTVKKIDPKTGLTLQDNDTPIPPDLVKYVLRPTLNEDGNKNSPICTQNEALRGGLVYRKFALAAGVVPYEQFLGPYGHKILALRKSKTKDNGKMAGLAKKGLGATAGFVGKTLALPLNIVRQSLNLGGLATMKIKGQKRGLGNALTLGTSTWANTKVKAAENFVADTDHDKRHAELTEYSPFVTYYIQSRFKLMVNYGPWQGDLDNPNSGIVTSGKNGDSVPWKPDIPQSGSHKYAFKNVIEGHTVQLKRPDDIKDKKKHNEFVVNFRNGVVSMIDDQLVKNDISFKIMYQILSIYMYNNRVTRAPFGLTTDPIKYGGKRNRQVHSQKQAKAARMSQKQAVVGRQVQSRVRQAPRRDTLKRSQQSRKTQLRGRRYSNQPMSRRRKS
jgi:hypothetical protein